MTTTSDGVRGHLSAVFTIVVWSSTFVATKVLLQQFSPIEIIFFRFLLGWGFLWLIRPKRLVVGSRKLELLFALAGLTGVTLNYLLETFALLYSQASTLAVIVSTAPLFVGILSVFVLKQRVAWNFIVGFFVSITGIVLISFPDRFDLQISLTGTLLGIAVAFVWAIYSILTEKLGAHGFDVILTTRRTFFYGILFMLPFAAFYGVGEHASLWLRPQNLLLLLYLGVVACAVSYITWNYAVNVIGSVKSNLYFYAGPVVTIVFSVCFLHEKVTGRSALGMLLTIAGVVLSGDFLKKKK